MKILKDGSIFLVALIVCCCFSISVDSAPTKAYSLNGGGYYSPGLSLNADFEKPGGGDVIESKCSSIFSSKTDEGKVVDLRLKETLKLSGKRIAGPPLSVGESVMRKGASFGLLSGGKKKRMAVSMISSALLPGLGEFFLFLDTGDKSILARAIGFFALEGYLWYGYNRNHDKGKDFKRQYEEYGDAHWSEKRFLDNHPYCHDNPASCDTWEDYNNNAKNNYAYFYYTPLEMDTEEYYENMGKYDAFLYGWDDWNGYYAHELETPDPNYWTPHRTYYWSLRDESNKYLLRADQHIMGLIASRIVSMVHSGWLASRGVEESGEGWSFHLENGRLYSRFGLRYKF